MNGPQPIKIAVLAMGGEGGGVLADWIVQLGEHNGHIAQTTSVPGVAQRTGATIYYVELFPKAQAERDGGHPVLALMPLPGDVDIVLASELMEAGRAVQRGLVTPDRTTLVASTHRVYSIAEKTAMGDGRVDSGQLGAHTRAAAKRLVQFDMAAAATETGSLISAVLFGALAATGVLPFSRAQFEATIERGGIGVKTSLRGFAAGHTLALSEPGAVPSTPTKPAGTPQDPALQALLSRLQAFPAALQPLLLEGLRRTVDYQDADYGRLYLDRLQPLLAGPAVAEPLLLQETARHLALWMSYEDTIRVAELKTRGSRLQRVHDEAQAEPDQVLHVSEYLHPRLQEVCEVLPVAIGRWLAHSGAPRRLVERFTHQGRRVTTSSLRGFLLLYGLASLKRWRRGTLRFAVETQRIEAWLATVTAAAASNPQLAVEVARCQRLVKGYSDTHERGLRHFETLMAVVSRLGAALAPAALQELRDAALADEQGARLNTLLQQRGWA